VDETLGRIEVVDSGFGIEPDDQKRLFEPFQRFGDHQVEGTGLGLALSERFIKLMGGRLGLAESSKTGSTFFIELDRSAPHTKEFEAASAGDSLPESLATCAGTVLYVEDNPANLRLLEIVFGEAPNLKLLSAGDGARGIELAIDKQPDIILLDLHLPDVNGDEVLQQLKAEPKTQSIPVVMISADATPKQRRALRAAGAVEYLTKPLNLKLLFSVLAEYLAE
jgi:CheY-like chemotaxis protein